MTKICFEEGTVMLATVYDEKGIEDARAYVKRLQLSHDDVKIVGQGNFVMVKAKRRIEFGETGGD